MPAPEQRRTLPVLAAGGLLKGGGNMSVNYNNAAAGETISLAGVSKTYMTAKGPLPVLRDIDLEVKAGEFVSFVGPSGCGKSTLLKIIAGLVSYDTGNVSVGGDAPREGREDIGFMLQQSVLMPWLNVSKNVELPFAISGRRDGNTAKRVADLLELVSLTPVAKLNPWELSGGMQQRVALARALALDPGIMLMDEPFSALDEFKREFLNIEVAQMADTLGKTTLLVTHSIAEAVLMSDRIIALGANPGRVVGDIKVDLERPRRSDMVGTDRFQEISNEVRVALAADLQGAK
ncbi:ABC transporter ATP-binding protein [Octadecabacter sp. SW4]|uniref:ABC transporter ATP-binding protein n=1 Tax=Octadecabacter sp. SW4 TaxID=2602067 RepID=UPI0011C1EF32|nr:ABC transporter ATP-binding protein [Octadecabacter sp. SW4]QEE36109.1 ABC transporter ATP-binding protein [Octadecabacter sp. SW4]